MGFPAPFSQQTPITRWDFWFITLRGQYTSQDSCSAAVLVELGQFFLRDRISFMVGWVVSSSRSLLDWLGKL
ncbi:hypothetical protein RRG08_061152 [Elysia crispata]|uniref:Uncharacterized protein n=1 Tax=Elysia crispata TaxID=231223 RepID=A0AAE0XDS1_9GAST|nr:hypothetical protein RRG08_061152 [Elysia crispata]